MKTLTISLSFAILSLVAVGCKKDKNEVDPAPIDKMPGEYKMTGVTSYTIDGAVSSFPTTGSLSVYAGNTPGTYYILERYSTTELGYLATAGNGSYSVEKVPDFSVYNSVKYYGYQSGIIVASNENLVIDRYADTNSSTYIAPTGSSFNYTKNIRKRVTMTATK